VLDAYMQPLPAGATGELFLGGTGLAAGYQQLPDLTAEKFVSLPWDLSQKVYRSGDIGCYLPDGNLRFAGRKDQQIKIRGYRVECSEIESVIGRYIKQTCIVMPLKDTVGDLWLAAYFVGITPAEIESLKAALGQLLPFYMQPAVFHVLPAWPLNRNGKIDRQQLPILQPQGQADTQLDNPIERRLAIIWQEVLGNIFPVTPSSDFIRMGGHSLKIIRLLARLNRDMQVVLSLKEFFDHTIFKDQAALIAGKALTSYEAIPVLPSAEEYVLSYGQQRVWIHARNLLLIISWWLMM
jgi:hypothetical protein